jgi:hypothetical protein
MKNVMPAFEKWDDSTIEDILKWKEVDWLSRSALSYCV